MKNKKLLEKVLKEKFQKIFEDCGCKNKEELYEYGCDEDVMGDMEESEEIFHKKRAHIRREEKKKC